MINAFRDYTRWTQLEIARRDRHSANLPPRYKSMLPPEILEFKSRGMQLATSANQNILDAIADAQEDQGFGGEINMSDSCGHDHVHEHGDQHGNGHGSSASARATAAPEQHKDGGGGAAPTSSPLHYSKVKSTLHQLARDWSDEGAEERKACYGSMITELERVLPVTAANRNKQRVLVPGCGLGRLPYELASRGYAAQGNEFSYFMLFASHLILNCLGEEPNSIAIHPWIHDASNHMRPQDMLRPVPLPDVPPCTLATTNPGADLSMTAGEFLEVYATEANKGAWDAVLTCFFIDTAPVVFEYIDVIWQCLKPGGVWLNCGPLLYHWQELAAEQPPAASAAVSAASSSAQQGGSGTGDVVDDRYHRSVELSYMEIRHAISARGFSIVKEGKVSTPYAADRLSLMRTMYTGICFTAVKPVEAKEGSGA